MSALPWYVVHGVAIGWALALAIVPFTCFLVWLRGGRRLARAVARARRQQEALAASAWRDGAEATVVGTLQAEGALAAAPAGGAPVALATYEDPPARRSSSSQPTHARAGVLRLRADDETCEIRGEVVVLAGSRATALSGGLRALQPGDRVWMQGVLRQRDDAGPDYRASEVGWILEGTPEKPLTAMYDGSPRWRPRLLEVLGRGVLVGVFMAPLALWLLGAVAMHFDAHRLATISPFSRERALHGLRADLERDKTLGDRQRLSSLVRVNQLLGDCEAETDVLLAHGQLRAAAERLSQCGTRDAWVHAAATWVSLGEYGKASEAFDRTSQFPPPKPPPPGVLRPLEDPRFVATVHLLAGRFGAAATAIRRLTEPDLPGVYISKISDFDVKEVARCVADALDARAGDGAALERLSHETIDECRLLHADLLQGEKRLTALVPPPSRRDAVAAMLAFEAGGKPQRFASIPLPDGQHTPLRVLTRPLYIWPQGLGLATLATLESQPEASTATRSMRAYLATHAALWELAAGDAAAARRWVDIAVAAAAQSQPEALVEALGQRLSAAALQAVVAARAGDFATMTKVIDPWRKADSSTWAALSGLDHPPALTEWEAPSLDYRVRQPIADLLVFEAVALGAAPADLPARTYDSDDAAETSRGIHALRTASWMPPDVNRYAPLGTLLLGAQGDIPQRAALADWVEVGQWPRRVGLGDRMNECAILADVAAKVGNEQFAAEQRAIVARIKGAMSRRDVAVPLMVLEAME